MSRSTRRTSAGKILLRLVLLAAVLAGLYLIVAPIMEIGGVNAPKSQAPTLIRLNQSWTEEESVCFHHTSQGTRILPVDWFMAMEQPVLTFLPVGRLSSRDFLGRFGFMYETERPELEKSENKKTEYAKSETGYTGKVDCDAIRADAKEYDLPIGFAIEKKFYAPYGKPPISEPTAMVGLTCAGCHTGRIEVKLNNGTTKAVLIDGGSAMISISLFQDAVGRALAYTLIIPERFRRFARAVLKSDRSETDPEFRKLKKELSVYFELGLATQNYAKEHKLDGTQGGFSRTDALGLIGNRVFGVLSQENQVATTAPVNFPHLWDTPWFDWVQYNGSIRMPMARNIGEALGVGALVNLNDPKYDSTVNINGLAWMEELLGGMNPFEGLQPPRWDDMVLKVFGEDAKDGANYRISKELAKQGEELYKIHCVRCHLPPRDELKAQLHKGDFTQFSKPDPESKQRFLRLNVVDLNVIGTDPNQALSFYRRVAVSPEPRRSKGAVEEYKKQTQKYGDKTSEKKGADQKEDDWQTYDYWSRWVKQGVTDGGPSATISAEEGLFRVTSTIREKIYSSEEFQLLPEEPGNPYKVKKYANELARKEERIKWDRFRALPSALDRGDPNAVLEGEDKDWVIKANLGYRARPHSGVWATPPYLHNSSVPNLYQMLVPAASRSKKFYLGSTRFDPKHVGYETHQFPGAFELDTSLPGNSNSGHEFRNLTLEELEESDWDGVSTIDQRWARVLHVTPAESLSSMPTVERWKRTRQASEDALKDAQRSRRVKPGVLGPEFTDDQRWQLVEYLKTL
jgi:hypothetical protein